MEKGSLRGDEDQNVSNGDETASKEALPVDDVSKQVMKHKSDTHTGEHTSERALETIRDQPTTQGAAANDESETPPATSSNSSTAKRLPPPPPSAETLARVEAELRRRYKKRRINTTNVDTNENYSMETGAAASQVINSDDAHHTRALSKVNGNQEQKVTPDGTENPGNERKDGSADLHHSAKQPRAKQNTPSDEAPKNSSRRASSSSGSQKESGESQETHNRNNEKNDSPGRSKSSRQEDEYAPLPNTYREEFRNSYRQLTRHGRTKPIEPIHARGRTKRTLTGTRPRRVIPKVNAFIWRVRYETGCLPGGSHAFKAPQRCDVDVCESLDRAGHVGMGLLARKLGYRVKEMKALGGYGIEVEEEEHLEIAWRPPDSEYSRVILNKLPADKGLWVVDIQCGVEYDGTKPFRAPQWRTVGPFRDKEAAVVCAKGEIGAARGWGWERVCRDGAFEIMRDTECGWVGQWNPVGREYSRVAVKIIGWPGDRAECLCGAVGGDWKWAFGLGERGWVEWREV